MALDVTGNAAELGIYLTLDNLSAGGFYVRWSTSFEAGQKVFLVTQISQAVIVVRAAVLRTDKQVDGLYGHAFVIEQHQIFSLGDAAAKHSTPNVSCPDDKFNESEKESQ